MSSETKSIKQPVSLIQNSRSIILEIADYFRITMVDYPRRSSFRISIYLLKGILIGLFQRTMSGYPRILSRYIIFLFRPLLTQFGQVERIL
jgi:hypothetical protein